jgi:hypothetical protein
VAAAGAGWAWLRAEPLGRPAHLTGRGGPRGPLTLVVDRVPVLAPGDRVALDSAGARPWRTPVPPAAADPDAVAAACRSVTAHLWNDPRALELGRRPLGQVAPGLVGRGPGLTPAGDDVLLGWLLARRARNPAGARGDAALVLGLARRGTGAVSRGLLRWAARGEAPEPVALMLAALVGADGPGLGPAVRRLAGYGRTTGRAALTGLVAGLLAD